MLDIDEKTRQLAESAEAVRALAQSFSDEHARWQPDEESWSLKRVMEHLYNEERLDFRKHLKEMFSDPPQPWGAFRPEDYIAMVDGRQALEGFMEERQASIAWLSALESPDWDTSSQARSGPNGDVRTFSAGDVLVSWIAHDILHMRQMVELLYAWNERQALPHSVEYAGGW